MRFAWLTALPFCSASTCQSASRHWSFFASSAERQQFALLAGPQRGEVFGVALLERGEQRVAELLEPWRRSPAPSGSGR